MSDVRDYSIARQFWGGKIPDRVRMLGLKPDEFEVVEWW